jgi:HEAT repeat protein
MNRAFISYVGENRATVVRLAQALRAFDVDVWLDRDRLSPGMRWRTAIREAIAHGDFFIACFSREYQERSRSYMNEELVLAIDELRRRTTTRAWFIPVLLNECEVPDRDIGAGETLRSLQWVNLYEDWDDGVGRILTVVAPTSAKLHALQRQLDSESARERIRAADELAAMGSLAQPAVPALTALLSDPNETVRAAAAAALGSIGAALDETIAELLRIMRRGDFYDSRHAAHALAKLGHRAVPALREAATYPGYGVGSFAEEALADVRDPAAVPHLLREARKGSMSAVEGLGRIGRPAAAAVPFLVDLIQDPDTVRQWYAIEALGKIGDASVVPALAAKLRSSNGRTRWETVEALGRISDPSTEPLIAPTLSDPDHVVRSTAVEALDWSRFPGDALVMLAELLHDTDLVVRMHAAEVLGNLADVRAVPLLVDALNDDPDVVRAAAYALGSLKDEAAVPALVRKLAHDKEWVRDSVSEALLEIGSEEAIRAVRQERARPRWWSSTLWRVKRMIILVWQA